MKAIVITTICGAVLCGLGITQSHAAEVKKLMSQNAPGVCGAVDPANDIYLRRYPPSLYNAKPGPVQVICQATAPDAPSGGSGSGTTYGGLYFKNNTATTGTVACTMTAGTTSQGTFSKFKANSIPPGALQFIGWNSANPSELPTGKGPLNFSCTLPRGFAVHNIFMYYMTEIGS